jgi:hypothetical protein
MRPTNHFVSATGPILGSSETAVSISLMNPPTIELEHFADIDDRGDF